jgi:hypothetical protein
MLGFMLWELCRVGEAGNELTPRAFYMDFKCFVYLFMNFLNLKHKLPLFW